jgi:hypothetical protein
LPAPTSAAPAAADLAATAAAPTNASYLIGSIRHPLSPLSHYRQLLAEARALPHRVRASRAADLALELSALYAAMAEDEEEEGEDSGEEESAPEHQPELEAALQDQLLAEAEAEAVDAN